MTAASEYAAKSCFATLPRTTRGMPLVLGGDPKGKNFLYCNGNSVIIRDISNPAICEIYTEHSVPTTVAKYAPSGFYIASGDQAGKIRIWDTTQSTHILKAEYQPINGAIRDISWSADSQRIAVVGEGKERFGHVFLFDTGTSNGNLSGQSKALNSVDMRPTRPFRLVTASEDNTVAIFEGPPFKFKTHYQVHSRFAHCVRYSPDGSLFASCGADGKVCLFEGGEGTPQGEMVDPGCKGNAHSGGAYSVSWSPDGRRLMSVSADKTCKLWDVQQKALLTTFVMGDQVDDQQLSCLWQGDHILSVSLSGFINYLDQNNPSRPLRVIKGHNRPVTSLQLSSDRKTIYSADMDGHITNWNANDGTNDRIAAKVHKSQVQSMAVINDTLVSAGMDDTAAFIKLPAGTSFESLKLNSQPRGVAVSRDGSLTALACYKEIVVLRGQKPFASLALNYETTCVAMHPTNRTIAVGGQNNKVQVYQLSGEQLSLAKELTHTGIITAVAYSDDGHHLVACDAARRVVPYKLPDYQVASSKEWTFHTARVNCVAWCPDNRHLATGSLDTNIIVWDLEHSGEHPIIVKGAHQMSQITGVGWLDEKTVVTTGQDSNVKQFVINY